MTNHDVPASETRLSMDISEREFNDVRRLLYEHTGIALGDSKRQMVVSRLSKRLKLREVVDFGEYLTLLKSEGRESTEFQEFVNCLTTNKTDFFRESHHFDFLTNRFIPSLRASGKRRIRIWSAGCSTGEEPYTIAMSLLEACQPSEQWDIEILASDIDTNVLNHGIRGIYDLERASDIPLPLLKKYFLRGRGKQEGTVAAKKELKDLISFKQINLIEDQWPINSKFDLIFCRNVVIYFDRPTQEKLFKQFWDVLAAGAPLILGHSENIHWMSEHFKSIGATIYESTKRDRPSMMGKMLPTSRQKAVDKSRQLAVHNIVLGDIEATRTPKILKTLLGSCISACLYDPQTGVGGMNHFSLPGVSDEGVSARYGAHAMELLITAIMKKGGDRQRLRAKIFGGASLFRKDSEHFNVGPRNVEFVKKFLNLEGIPIDAECLGGTHGLLVKFQPHCGKAAVKPLSNNLVSEMLKEESQYARNLNTYVDEKPCGDIELF